MIVDSLKSISWIIVMSQWRYNLQWRQVTLATLVC